MRLLGLLDTQTEWYLKVEDHGSDQEFCTHYNAQVYVQLEICSFLYFFVCYSDWRLTQSVSILIFFCVK